MESKEIGLKSDVALGLRTLGMGTTDEIFQLDGSRQHLMKRLVTEEAIASVVDFSIRAEIQSGLLA